MSRRKEQLKQDLRAIEGATDVYQKNFQGSKAKELGQVDISPVNDVMSE